MGAIQMGGENWTGPWMSNRVSGIEWRMCKDPEDEGNVVVLLQYLKFLTENRMQSQSCTWSPKTSIARWFRVRKKRLAEECRKLVFEQAWMCQIPTLFVLGQCMAQGA